MAAAVAALKEQGLVTSLRDERLAHLSLLDNLTFPLLCNLVLLLEAHLKSSSSRKLLARKSAPMRSSAMPALSRAMWLALAG